MLHGLGNKTFHSWVAQNLSSSDRKYLITQKGNFLTSNDSSELVLRGGMF